MSDRYVNCRCIPRCEFSHADGAPPGIDLFLSRAEYLERSPYSRLSPEARQELIRAREEMLREPIVVAMSPSPEPAPRSLPKVWVKLPDPPPATQTQTSRMDYLEIEELKHG